MELGARWPSRICNVSYTSNFKKTQKFNAKYNDRENIHAHTHEIEMQLNSIKNVTRLK